MSFIYKYLLLFLVVIGIIHGVPYNDHKRKKPLINDHLNKPRIKRADPCTDGSMCRSKWGYCGKGPDYCGEGCQAGPCDGGDCPDKLMCRSKYGYCGKGAEYCGEGCRGGPCTNNNNNNKKPAEIINEQTFGCAFNTIDSGTRANRLKGLRQTGWKPKNKDEAAVFLAHVFHETDGLKTLREYCAPG